MQTRRKTDFTQNVEVGAYNKEGDEHSFFYEGTKLFIDTLLDANITFIPTTARNEESYSRTIFAQNASINLAILNFGGTILRNNRIDEAWRAHMDSQYAKVLAMEEVMRQLNEAFGTMNLVVKIVDGFYVSIYNKYNLDNKRILANIQRLLNDFVDEHRDFYIYENGNSFAILPNFLNKKFAVEQIIREYKPILTMGAGDNLSDLDFMNLAHFHIVPNRSFIHQQYN